MVAIALEDLTKVFPDGTVAVDNLTLDVAQGEFVVLLGPTGCGKTTVLRLIAGLEQASAGHISIGGQLADNLPPRLRGTALVFQDYALYPHLTVAENIAFPLRTAHAGEREVASRVAEAAAALSVTDLLRKSPRQLSGGQRQRVAMARAVARRPFAFLLDEPLSNVDAALRAELRAEIADVARGQGITTVYVTHDQTEAMTLGDRVAVLRRGVLQQVGTPDQVYGDPETLFVAAFVGTPRMNLLQAAVYAERGERLVIDFGAQVIALPWDDPRARLLAEHHTARVTVGLRPEALSPAGDGDGPVLRGVVRLVENHGHELLVYLDTGAVSTAPEYARLELPDGNLAHAVAEQPPTGHGFRRALAHLIPHRHRVAPPPTARTAYGFYPVYESEAASTGPGDLVVRMPPGQLPRTGTDLALRVDLDQMYLFDPTGSRIRLP